MKKLTVLLAGLGIATAAIPAVATAAPFGPAGGFAPAGFAAPNQRAQMIQMRIDQGIRSGALNRFEAQRLQSDLRGIQSLEYRYARSGGRIDYRERADLDHRYDALSAKVKVQKNDRDGRGGRRW